MLSCKEAAYGCDKVLAIFQKGGGGATVLYCSSPFVYLRVLAWSGQTRPGFESAPGGLVPPEQQIDRLNYVSLIDP